MDRPLRRTVTKRVLLIGIAAFLLALCLEGVFRMLPVSNGYFLADVTTETPIARRVADIDAVASRGWRMEEAVRRRVNNEGFINATDYVQDESRPVITLIGDSQIEAPGIDEAETVHHRLRVALNDTVSVYTFAMSGAPLTQYAVWARHARDSFGPMKIVIFLSANDFDESFDRFGLFPGFHYAHPMDGDLAVAPREYTRGLAGVLVQNSSFLAYLVHNLDLPTHVKHVLRSITPDARASESHATISDAEFSALQDWFFAELSANGLKPSDTAFILNPENTSYTASVSCDTDGVLGPQFAQFKARALEEGFKILDATPAFCRHHRSTGRLLVLEDGIHWNAEGHAAMAPLLRDLVTDFPGPWKSRSNAPK